MTTRPPVRVRLPPLQQYNRRQDEHIEEAVPKELTGWNLYNAVQGTYQHDTRHTKNHERSLLIGSIAANSEMSLNVVKTVLFDELTRKTSTKEFDELFAKVA